MEVYEKFVGFFKNKGISQTEISKEIGISKAMVGRYLRRPNFNFILLIVQTYPDIDLNYIFKNEAPVLLNVIKEPTGKYVQDNNYLLEILEKTTEQLRANLNQNPT